MLKPGDIIRHKAMPKIQVQIISSMIDPHTDNLLIRGAYTHTPMGNISSGNERMEFFIKPEHVKNWSKLTKNNEWKPI